MILLPHTAPVPPQTLLNFSLDRTHMVIFCAGPPVDLPGSSSKNAAGGAAGAAK